MIGVIVRNSVKKIRNRFDLILVASRRARQIQLNAKYSTITLKKNSKCTVVALKEIEQNLIKN